MSSLLQVVRFLCFAAVLIITAGQKPPHTCDVLPNSLCQACAPSFPSQNNVLPPSIMNGDNMYVSNTYHQRGNLPDQWSNPLRLNSYPNAVTPPEVTQTLIPSQPPNGVSNQWNQPFPTPGPTHNTECHEDPWYEAITGKKVCDTPAIPPTGSRVPFLPNSFIQPTPNILGNSLNGTSTTDIYQLQNKPNSGVFWYLNDNIHPTVPSQLTQPLIPSRPLYGVLNQWKNPVVSFPTPGPTKWPIAHNINAIPPPQLTQPLIPAQPPYSEWNKQVVSFPTPGPAQVSITPDTECQEYPWYTAITGKKFCDTPELPPVRAPVDVCNSFLQQTPNVLGNSLNVLPNQLQNKPNSGVVWYQKPLNGPPHRQFLTVSQTQQTPLKPIFNGGLQYMHYQTYNTVPNPPSHQTFSTSSNMFATSPTLLPGLHRAVSVSGLHFPNKVESFNQRQISTRDGVIEKLKNVVSPYVNHTLFNGKVSNFLKDKISNSSFFSKITSSLPSQLTEQDSVNNLPTQLTEN